MGRADRPPHRIPEQDHVAVGGKDHQRDIRLIADQGVHAGIVPLPGEALAAVGGGDPAHHVVVGLLAEDAALRRHAQSGTEPAIVFGHAGRIIPPADAQIQGIPGGRADAAPAGGKAVAHAAQYVAGQEDQTVFFTSLKGHGASLLFL